MTDYILLMHNDAPAVQGSRADHWAAYFAKLRAANAFLHLSTACSCQGRTGYVLQSGELSAIIDAGRRGP